LSTSTAWLKYLKYLSSQRFSLIRPLERLCHRAVEVFDKLQNAVFELRLTGKT